MAEGKTSMAIRKNRNLPVQLVEMGPSIAAIESKLDQMDEGISNIIDYFFNTAGDKGLFELVARSGYGRIEGTATIDNKEVNVEELFKELRDQKLSESLDELARAQSNASNDYNRYNDDVKSKIQEAMEPSKKAEENKEKGDAN